MGVLLASCFVSFNPDIGIVPLPPGLNHNSARRFGYAIPARFAPLNLLALPATQSVTGRESPVFQTGD
jgi:hypothetical protein